MSFIKFLCCVLVICPLLLVTAGDITTERLPEVRQVPTQEQIPVTTVASNVIPVQKEPRQTELKVVKSATSYVIGDLVDLSASIDGLDESDDVIYEWQIRPEVEFVRWIDGSKILFGTGHEPVTYTVFLSVSIKSEDLHQLHTEIVDIVVSSESDNKTSVKVPIATDFVNAIKQLSSSVVIDDNYNKDEFVTDAKDLSTKFADLKARIDSGQIKDLDNTLNEIRKIIEGFKNAKKWEPLFVGIGALLEQESKTGSLDEPVNVSIAMKSISDGLNQIQ